MRFTIVTLFPEFFDSPLSCGLLAKAQESGAVRLERVNPRDFALDKHRSVDDRPFGGGPGMVMSLAPLAAALRAIPDPGRLLLLSPRGKPLTQALARDLAKEESLTLICGRYEGIDERLGQLFPLEAVSVGDFVLNGGETGALCVIEAVARLREGFMGHADSGAEESFSEGLLEYPHYTRPEIFEDLAAPEALLSGDHAAIAAWRREASLLATLETRPELLDQARLSPRDLRFIRRAVQEKGRLRPGRNLFLVLVHHPVLNSQGQIVTTSLTNLDIHDIARVSRSNGLGGYFLATPLEDQRRLAERLIAHWTQGAGREANPDRARALELVRVVAGLDEALLAIETRTGARPFVLSSSARLAKGAKRASAGEALLSFAEARDTLRNGPMALVLGTGSGLAPEIAAQCDGCLKPLRFMDDENHFSVRAAAAIMVDRILGDAF